jgi:hypothetical protein
MDWQIILNIGAGATIAVGGWFEVENFRSDMDKRFDRIEMLLDKLYEKLDGKVDK